MARPIKEGLDYFPLDVDIDQDDKIQVIEALHGVGGFGVVIKLLMKIYKEGYFYEWNNREQILFSKRVNVNINEVNVIVNDCIKEGLFSKEIFEANHVLTSKGIQRRYLEAAKRRKELEFRKELFLLDIAAIKNILGSSKTNIYLIDVNNNRINVYNNSNNGVNVNINGVNANINTQRKEKERKEKERKENNITDAAVNAFDFYEQNFGVLSSFIADDLGQWIDDLNQELVIRAMQKALEQNKRQWGYVKSILNDWAKNKFTTIEQVEAADLEFRNRNKKGEQKNGEHEPDDEWSKAWAKKLERLKHAEPNF
jgi:DnaD/phage-associated family protein